MISTVQYMPFKFSTEETKKAHQVSVFEFLQHKNRYELKPVLDEKKNPVTFNGHNIYDVYKDGTRVQTRRIIEGLSSDDNAFYSATDFLMENEGYTPLAAVMEVYLCIYGFPTDYQKYANKTSPQRQFLDVKDLLVMNSEQISDLRPRSVSIKDWENSTTDGKLTYIQSSATQDEKVTIEKRYHKKVPASKVVSDYGAFVAPNPQRYCRHIEDFLVKTLNVSRDIVGWLIAKHLLYEDYQGNLIAPGYDKQGNIRFAYIRSCFLRSEARNIIDKVVVNSDPHYTWRYINPASEGLYLFESIIDCICYMDLMDLISKHPSASYINQMKMHSFMYVGHFAGENIPEWIEPTIRAYTPAKKIYICFENDYDRVQNYGQVSALALQKFLSTKGYHVENIVPEDQRSFTEYLSYYKREYGGLLS